MINALTPRSPPDYSRAATKRIKSILKKEAHIYWIAYLQKKLMQQEKQGIVEMRNQSDASALEKYQQDFTMMIKKRVNRLANEAAEVRREQMMRQKGMLGGEGEAVAVG